MELSIEQARVFYPGDDPVHGFDHVLRVYRIAERLAREESANLEIVRTAALLHDSKGADPRSEANEREIHHLLSAEFAETVLTEMGWQPERIAAVQHCIRSHRYRAQDEPPRTIEAMCLFDADKLDVLGAIGAARTTAFSAQADLPFYHEPSQRFLESGEHEPDEPHSAYHEYLFKLRFVHERLLTKAGRAIAQQRNAFLRQYFEQLQAECRGER
jgi:uncharacterized protein